MVDNLIEKMNGKETDNIIGIRHYNSLRISETEVEKYRLANPDIDFFYHHFDTSDIDDPFAPFLSIIKQLIHRNDVDVDTFIEVCGGYSLQRHALSSYFNDEPVLREEEYIYNEIDFEYKKMCVAIVNMLGYFARQKKIIIVMNKLHRGSSSTVDILTEIANTGDNNIGVIFSYNDFAVCPEYMEKRWKSFIEYVDRHNNLKDWGFNTLLNQKYKSEPFDFFAGKMMEYIEKLEKMYNLVDLEQANFYAKVIHRKLILEEFNISPIIIC